MFQSKQTQKEIIWAIENNYYNLLRIYPLDNFYKIYGKLCDFIYIR